MKETKTKSKKRVIYYLVLAVSVLLLVAATVLTVYFVTSGGDKILEENPPVEDPDDPTPPDDPTGGDTVKFVSPIEDAEFKVEYGTIYANKTLGWYYRHKALDFLADAGTIVRSMSEGRVETISYSEETGNFIVIDHGDNLRSYYRFVEPASGLKVGDSVKMGQTIATVASAYGTEKFDGAHLHLEVTLKGEPVDPTAYLDYTVEDK